MHLMSRNSERVLIVLTSHQVLGSTGKSTGFHAGEAAEPWSAFRDAGLDVEVASVAGGQAPVTSRVDGDAIQDAFFAEVDLTDTPRAADLEPARYAAVLFAGGHGTMWDFPNSSDLSRLISSVYERGGVIAAVCHGPAALVGARMSNGEYLVAGKRVAAFTNEEESAIGLTDVVPFLLADALTEQGAKHEPGPMWQAQVVVDDRLVTGQNPQSASGVAERVISMLTESSSRHDGSYT
jgi:putative intracellular protease/amidase